MKHLYTILLGILLGIFIGLNLLGLEDVKSKVIFAVLMTVSHASGLWMISRR